MLLSELHYLPSVAFFSELKSQHKLLLEACENYQKQTYRNRCYILSANGILPLVIPVSTSSSKLITEVTIDYSQRWTQIHLRAIQSAYGKSAFFEHYFPYFEKIYLSKCPTLFEFNSQILTLCLKLLKWPIKPHFTTDFIREYNDNTLKDARNIFSPEVFTPSFSPNHDKKYFQAFGNIFVNNLSIVDLLFNEGTNAGAYL